MVEKKDGAEMTCKSCGTELICHMSNYKGDFKNKLQWQNEDGTAHYKFNGTEYSCNIPEETDPNEIMLNPKDDSTSITQETTLETNTSNQLTSGDNSVTEKAILEAILHVLVDIKKILDGKQN